MNKGNITKEKIITYIKEIAQKNVDINIDIKPSTSTESVYAKIYNDKASTCFRISDHSVPTYRQVSNLVIKHNTSADHIYRYIDNRFKHLRDKTLDITLRSINK